MLAAEYSPLGASSQTTPLAFSMCGHSTFQSVPPPKIMTAIYTIPLPNESRYQCQHWKHSSQIKKITVLPSLDMTFSNESAQDRTTSSGILHTNKHIPSYCSQSNVFQAYSQWQTNKYHTESWKIHFRLHPLFSQARLMTFVLNTTQLHLHSGDRRQNPTVKSVNHR